MDSCEKGKPMAQRQSIQAFLLLLRYRVQIEIGVANGSDLKQVRRVIKQAVRSVDGVIPEKPVDVLFLEFGDSSMTLRVRWWIESYADSRRIFDKVNEAISW
jgi:small-conductance mechanosensitive channel